jgi:hypothetical protein
VEFLQSVLKALKRLLPQLRNSGAGAVQVGQAGGDVKVITMHQHFYAPQPMAAPAAAPAPAPKQAEPARAARPLTEVHRQALALMDPLPKKKRIAVLGFMRREFGTGLVRELDPREAHRLRLYVRQVRANDGREGASHERL